MTTFIINRIILCFRLLASKPTPNPSEVVRKKVRALKIIKELGGEFRYELFERLFFDIVGVEIDNPKRSAIQDSSRDISPAIHTVIYSVAVDGKNVWVIDAPS